MHAIKNHIVLKIEIPTLQVSRNPRTHARIYMGVKYDCCLKTGRIMLPNKLIGTQAFIQ